MPLDLSTVLDTIAAELSAEFTDMNVVVSEDQDRKELQVPALVLDIIDLEPDLDSDAETGQFPCLVHIEAQVVLGHRSPTVRRAVAQTAAVLAARVHKARFGLRWGAAELIAVEPDEFAPQADRFDLWRLEWTHRADIGDSLILTDGITPTTVNWSHTPKIGPAHEGDYSSETFESSALGPDQIVFNSEPVEFDGEVVVFNAA